MKTLDWSLPFCAALFVVLTIAPAAAPQTAAPMLINYQGKLRSPTTGDPVPDGDYDMVFRIYDVPGGGKMLWTGTHSTANGNPVRVANGIFSVILGSGTGNALDPSVFEGADRWLEIQVGSETLSPRHRMASVSYAVKSENSRLLDGKEKKDFAPSEHSHSGSDIKSGTVSEAQIDEAMTRDTEKDAAIAAHAAIADAHHARYTDAEAVAAMGARADTNPLNHDKTTSLPWGSITGIPGGFDDGVDNDTTYSASSGLDLTGTVFSVSFAGTGAATTVSRSDHSHGGDYWLLTGNAATDPATQFVGTSDNQALELRVNGVRAFRLEPNATSPNVIGGHIGNSASAGAVGAAIGGGGCADGENRITDHYGTIGGGASNQAGDNAGTTTDAQGATVGGGYHNSATEDYATVSGGAFNTASGLSYATVGGGYINTASGDSATVGGGYVNTASGLYATVGGGETNTGSGFSATVGGGLYNTASGYSATVGGGYSNQATADYATIAGGGPDPGSALTTRNRVTDDYGTIGGGGHNQAGDNAGTTEDAPYATVAGGHSNEASASYATVGGGSDNRALASYATIAGGGPSDPANPDTTRNLVTDDYGTIGGGGCNQAGDSAGTMADAPFASVGGGWWNTASNGCATVAGGEKNIASGWGSAVGGGSDNVASDIFATVGGGLKNTASGKYATAAGGWRNSGSGNSATVGGGYDNTASGNEATVGGGAANSASGLNATVGGGRVNTASGDWATVGGGESNTAAGTISFAAGHLAKANHDGAFVWADSNGFDFASTANNEFSARCTGGARFVSAIDATGNPTAGVQLAAGGGSWSSLSDVSVKENFLSMDGKQVLARLMAVPISAWNYKAQDPFIRHMGPMAQDFYAAFGLGEDDRHISTVDADGVAFAAIQGLHEIVEEKDAKISCLEKKNTELERRLGALEELVKRLTDHQGDQQ